MNLTSPSQVKSWCIENGFHPSRAMGQNFLIDRNVLDAIIEASGVQAGERVLEIGPGLGVLTEALLQKGALVTAVEKDARLAQHLATVFTQSHRDTEEHREDKNLKSKISNLKSSSSVHLCLSVPLCEISRHYLCVHCV